MSVRNKVWKAIYDSVRVHPERWKHEDPAWTNSSDFPDVRVVVLDTCIRINFRAISIAYDFNTQEEILYWCKALRLKRAILNITNTANRTEEEKKEEKVLEALLSSKTEIELAREALKKRNKFRIWK